MPCEAEVSDVDIVGMKFEVVSTFPEQTQYVGLKFGWQLNSTCKAFETGKILLMDQVAAVFFVKETKVGL